VSEEAEDLRGLSSPGPLPDPGEHPDPDRLYAYHAGELTPEEDAEIQEHLALCGACTELLLDVLSFTAPPAPQEAGLSEFERAAGWRQLRARLDQDGFFTRGRRPRRRVAAVAALFLLAVLGLSIYTLQKPARSQTLDPLDNQRGGPSAIERVRLPVTLVLRLPGETRFQEYQAEIRDLSERPIRRFSPLHQNTAFEVELKLDRGDLSSGEYHLELLGVRNGRSEHVADYGFKIPKSE
jgi:hypothetical protein